MTIAHRNSIPKTVMATSFLDGDNWDTSSNGPGCCPLPMKSIRNRAMVHHPISNKMATLTIETGLCNLAPKVALAICPPSNCQAGIRFRNVTIAPSQAAFPMGERNSKNPAGEGRTIPPIR